MKYIWNCIESASWSLEKKNRVFTWAVSLAFALIGAAAWMVVSPFACGGVENLAIFAGAAVLAAWVTVFLYTCRHPFCEKRQLTFPSLHDRL